MRFVVYGLALALIVTVALGARTPCGGNTGCRGGACINGFCAPFSGKGGPCDEAADCLYGNTCDATTKTCVAPCTNQVNCGTAAVPNCKNVQTDNSNCGACGRSCIQGSTCIGGSCICNSGTSNCNNVCIDVLSDSNNCGTCGNRCGASAFCSNGVCQCNSGYGNCDNNFATNGCEVSYFNNNLNCGSCGNNCGQRGTCAGYTCQCTTAAYGNCNNDFNTDGCEVIFATDDTYCGACGVGENCGGSGNTDSVCTSGNCGCSNANYLNCNNNYASDGCEIDRLTSDSNCGSCGTTCGGSGNTDSVCNSGSCGCSNANYLNCNNNYASDGCEIDRLTSDLNCGSCNNLCGGYGSYDSVCTSGSCGCPTANYLNCNNNYNSDGCETNINTDDTYCGACGVGQNCGGSYGYDSICVGGACECENAGFANCNGNYATDGCEAYLATDETNCGTCGTNCGNNAYCEFSSCRCDRYYADCDDDILTGCEIDLRTNVNYCGYCNISCALNEVCINGDCQLD